MRTLALVCLALLWTAPAMAQTAPYTDDAAADARIKTISYNENDVYTITTKYGYQTNIVFDRNESIDIISVGDRSLWQIIPSGNRLFIRPMQQGISTNMTILTNKRSYQFDLQSLSADAKQDNAIYVAKFIYNPTRMQPAAALFAPPPPPLPPSGAQVPPPPPPPPSAELAPHPVAPVYTNYNYTYTGPDELSPLQVFDNGTSTFLKYATLPNPLPEIYAVDKQGARTRIQTETKDSMIVIRSVASTLELKHSAGTITVYNEMKNPGN